MNRLGTALALLTLGSLPTARADDFALRDGDHVVFLGDSITAEGTYGRIIENYTLLRFPDRHVRFTNAGWGGDTASGGLRRLDRDVLDPGATVVIVAYGVNDIGWGTKADDAHRQAYLDGIRGIVERCKERKVRVYIGSAAITAENPDTAETGYLQTMCDQGMALARSLGEHSIDIARTMRTIQRRVLEANDRTKDDKDKSSIHAADGVHLNDLGQLAMAFAILKGLGAPAEVSSVVVDASQPSMVEAHGCEVSNLSCADQALTFDRRDQGLPLNLGLFSALQYRFIPVPDELNRYMLTVRGLNPGRYELKVDDRGLGTFPAEVLARGLNIASVTADGWQPGGPWEAQAWTLKDLTEARTAVVRSRQMTAHWLPEHPTRDDQKRQTETALRQIEGLQHTLVAPRPFHFELRPAPEKTEPERAGNP